MAKSTRRSVTLWAAACVFIAVFSYGCGRNASQYLARGNQFFDSGKYDDAAINYRNAIKKDPKSGEAYYHLALALTRLGKGGEAYQALLHAVELSPENTAAKVQLANLSLAAYAQDPKRTAAFYERAAKIADQLLKADPNSSDGLRLKGSIALIDNHPGEAVNLLRKSLQASPSSAEIHTELMEALLRDNQPEEGEREARAVIAQHPDYGVVYDLLLNQYVLEKRWDDGEALLKLRIANQPKDPSPIVRLAAFYVGRQRRDQADKVIDSMVAKHDIFPEADLLAGDFHAMVRASEKALEDYQRGLKRDKTREKIYQLRSAGMLAVLGRRDEALKAIDEYLTANPKDVAGEALKVSLLLEKGGAENKKSAAAIANDLAASAANNARIQLLTAQAALSNGEFDHATTRLQQVAKLEPRSTIPHLALARVYQVRKNYTAMLEEANAALAINNREETAHLYRVVALTGTGSFALAKTEAEQLARDATHARQAEMQLGIIALKEKKYAQAQEYFQKVYREGDQDVSPLAGLVTSLIAQNNSDRALALLAAEERRKSDSIPVQSLTAATAQAAGKNDLARSELQKVADESPNSAQVQIRIGELERKRRNWKAAIEAFQKAHQLEPNAKGIDALIAMVQDESGDKAAAMASYRKALAESPDNPLIMNNIAYLIAETGGDLAEANRLATQGLRKAPKNQSMRDTLGWVELQQGNVSAALPMLSSLINENPDNVTFRYHYAAALLKSGDRAAAKRQLEAALAKQPTQPIEKNIRALLAQAQ
ncbi:MAG TPA: tetratricopeptide repeat protein [Bryobacteraceae bacterium]|nr:tetratricopeptide repeat protein [Bryobacteraceae bacterium]